MLFEFFGVICQNYLARMEAVKRVIAGGVLSLARWLDTYFYQVAIAFAALGLFNYFFVKNWDKILFVACKDGITRDIQESLLNGADVNVQHESDCTPLIMACGTKQEEAAKILIDTGKCKIEVTDARGRSALLVASGSGIISTVKLLLKSKADVKASDNNGSIPLIVACFAGHAEVVRCLLAFNSEPRWKNKQGINALGAAISTHKEGGGRIDVMKELLSYSKKKDFSIVESRNSANLWTPLIQASYKGLADVVELLLEFGADVHARGKKGFTALIAASQNGWSEVVRVLLKHGADPHLALEDGSTAIVAASSGGYQEIVRLLAAHDEACLAVCFKNGSTPLMTAALSGYLSVVQVLLSQGAEVNTLNSDNWSALTVAAQNGCFQITRELLAHGAEVDACSDKGFTPLMYAVKAGHLNVVEELIAKGAKVNHFTLNADGNDLAPADMPLIYGYMTPLLLAINLGDVAIVKLLLQHGADLHLDLALLMAHSAQPEDKHSAAALEAIKKQIRLAEEKEKALKEAGSTEASAKNAAAAKEVQEGVARAHQQLEQFEEEQEQQEVAQREATFVYTFFSSPLLFAVYWNNREVVELLLRCEETRRQENTGVSGYSEKTLIQLKNAQNMSALQLATDYFYYELVLQLMRNSAVFESSEDFWRVFRFVRRLVYHWKFVSLLKFIFLCVSAGLETKRSVVKIKTD